MKLCLLVPNLRVSIPFKRESASKVSTWRKKHDWDVRIGFNSLQTGKCIERMCLSFASSRWCRVSIPFKRESASKVEKPAYCCFLLCSTGFNSLQTGKCIERETYAEADQRGDTMFQFPSNGKVHRKNYDDIANDTCGLVIRIVSIPFKRESASKVHASTRRQSTAKVIIVSIPFKRESASKAQNAVPDTLLGFTVSIPFKRESASKAPETPARPVTADMRFNSLQTGKCIESSLFYSNAETHVRTFVSFNSLQTGKCIERATQLTERQNCRSIQFQFPSNGKVHRKSPILSPLGP